MTNWIKIFAKVYTLLAIIFFIGMITFWICGPIQIAQICFLCLFWAVFGILTNNRKVLGWVNDKL